MNIENLQDHINTFSREIEESGFMRDLNDFIGSLPASQNNILPLREIAEKLLFYLDSIYESDLPQGLQVLLPKENIRPFTEESYDKILRELVEDTTIPLPEFFSKLTTHLNLMKKTIQQNINEIKKIEEFIEPYMISDLKELSEEDHAIIAIVFNEKETITNLKQFTKTLSLWNRELPIYHQLIKSESPEDVKLIEVQNGSIDLVINLDFDVAINLAEVFRIGFKAFVAYLTYKKLKNPIIETFNGNKRLITHEKKTEGFLLEGIGEAIQEKIMQQHDNATKTSNIDKTSANKKIQQVSKLIASHIVKGNDIKLLSLPNREEIEEDGEELYDEKVALREKSMEARKMLRLVPRETKQKLLDAYGDIEDKNDDVK